MRGPGLALAGSHAHAVQRRRDMLVRPSRRHAAHDCKGFVGRSAAVFAGLGFANPQLRMLAAAPMDRQDTSRAASSTSAMMSATSARRSCWRARIVTFGEVQAASRSSARPRKVAAPADGVALERLAVRVGPGMPRHGAAPFPSSSPVARRSSGCPDRRRRSGARPTRLRSGPFAGPAPRCAALVHPPPCAIAPLPWRPRPRSARRRAEVRGRRPDRRANSRT